jgi:hypothetical protein
MKNWKYIEGAKTGNIAADITTDGNTWFVTTSDGKKKEFPSEREAEAYVKKIKTGNDTPWEYAHRKPKVINDDKTGAEEFFKQLSDDVKEREEKDDKDIEKVGNREVYVNQSEQTKAVVYEDGTIMLWDKNGNNYKKIKAGSLEEARKKLNSDYKKVGNARYTTREDVISHLDTDLYDICKKVPAGSPSFAYVSELQKKGWDISTISKYTKEIGKIIDQYKVGNKKLKFTDKKDGLKEFVYDEENDKGYIYYDGKLVDTIPHAGQGWLNLIKQKAFSSGVMNKTGNAIGGGVQSETVLTETKDGSQYWVEKTSKSGQYAQYNLYYTIGQGKRHAGVFKDKEAAADAGRRIIGNSTWYEPRRMPFQPRSLQYAYEQAKKKGLSGQKLEAEMLRIAKTTPHDSAATESEMRKDVSEWVLSHGKPEDFANNKRTGNSAYDDGAKKGKEDKRKGKLITAAGFEYHAPGYSSLSFKEKEEYKKGYYSTNDLKKEDIYKWGNSASDDKFAYVMREFDEGKLKTPDGKVVTDPAQAKAIAYSESKKTENGLARARNAMNKRCGNSQVTLWKGNDSVLISEDGTVQYLESNSFETDRDKYGSMQEAIDDLTKKGYRKK